MRKKMKKLQQRVVSYFDNQEMYQILLKYNNDAELTLMEKQELDYWVYVYEHRNKLFKHLTLIIELRKQLKVIEDMTDLLIFLDKIKVSVPKEYLDTSHDEDYYALRSTVSLGLRNYSNEVVLRMIRGHMWGAVIVTFAIAVLVIFLVFMTIRFS